MLPFAISVGGPDGGRFDRVQRSDRSAPIFLFMHRRIENRPHPLTPARFWRLNVAAWTMLGALGTAQAFARADADGAHFTLSGSLALTLPFYWLWALGTPIVRRITASLRSFDLWVALAIHAVLIVIATVAHGIAYIALMRVVASLLHINPPTASLGVFLLRYGAADALIYLTIAIICVVGFGYERLRTEQRRAETLGLSAVRLEAELSGAKLDALRLQLHPHFLFNALNSIATLVLKGDGPGAIRMLSLLGDLLRGTLATARTNDVSLEEEMRLIERYVDVERVRFGTLLQVEWRLEPRALSHRVPSLILQPLIENAIRHGALTTGRRCTIVVAAAYSEDALRITVADDGRGFAASDAVSFGVGLTNTRDRLRHFYGEGIGFSITRGEPRGCIVVIDIPRGQTEPALVRSQG
jgi:signal transduction histidine kinase